MEQRGEQIVGTETEASAGSKEGVVRWVLGISLALVVVLLTIVWISGAMSQSVGSDEANSAAQPVGRSGPTTN